MINCETFKSSIYGSRGASYLVLPFGEYYRDPFQNLSHRLTVGHGAAPCDACGAVAVGQLRFGYVLNDRGAPGVYLLRPIHAA